MGHKTAVTSFKDTNFCVNRCVFEPDCAIYWILDLEPTV